MVELAVERHKSYNLHRVAFSPEELTWPEQERINWVDSRGTDRMTKANFGGRVILRSDGNWDVKVYTD